MSNISIVLSTIRYYRQQQHYIVYIATQQIYNNQINETT